MAFLEMRTASPAVVTALRSCHIMCNGHFPDLNRPLYCRQMSMKIFLSAGFAAHALLGNFCMMPMAFAQGMEMPHEEHMEMAMTPMSPMSPAHCEHCLKVESSDEDQSQQQSGCAGHCFSQANATRANAVSFQVPHIVAAPPLPITIAFISDTTSIVAPPATAPPTSIHIDTIVLRL